MSRKHGSLMSGLRRPTRVSGFPILSHTAQGTEHPGHTLRAIDGLFETVADSQRNRGGLRQVPLADSLKLLLRHIRRCGPEATSEVGKLEIHHRSQLI